MLVGLTCFFKSEVGWRKSEVNGRRSGTLAQDETLITTTLKTLTWFEQSDALRHQGFLATDRANQFARLGLQSDVVEIDLQ